MQDMRHGQDDQSCGRLLHQRAGQMSERASEASAWGRVHRGAGDGVGLDEPPGASGEVALQKREKQLLPLKSSSVCRGIASP